MPLALLVLVLLLPALPPSNLPALPPSCTSPSSLPPLITTLLLQQTGLVPLLLLPLSILLLLAAESLSSAPQSVDLGDSQTGRAPMTTTWFFFSLIPLATRPPSLLPSAFVERMDRWGPTDDEEEEDEEQKQSREKGKNKLGTYKTERAEEGEDESSEGELARTEEEIVRKKKT